MQHEDPLGRFDSIAIYLSCFADTTDPGHVWFVNWLLSQGHRLAVFA